MTLSVGTCASSNLALDISHVITHSSLSFAWPNNQILGFAPIVHTFAKDDDELYNDLNNERNKIRIGYMVTFIQVKQKNI